MLTGSEPGPATIRGLETYLNTVSDHGLNASTFAARVIIATESDMVSAVTGAIGALKGPLHGGAPGPALDMVFEIGQADRAEEYIRAKLDRGERLMGFGHRVYKVRDPRADVLAHAAERMYQAEGDMALYDLAKEVEATALRLLDEAKPGRNLRTNVEFFTALLVARARPPDRAVHPDLRGRQSGGLDRSHVRTAALGPADQTGVGLHRSHRTTLGPSGRAVTAGLSSHQTARAIDGHSASTWSC